MQMVFPVFFIYGTAFISVWPLPFTDNTRSPAVLSLPPSFHPFSTSRMNGRSRLVKWGLGHDYAVRVGVHVVSRLEGDSCKSDHNVSVAWMLLGTFHRICTQSFDSQGHGVYNSRVSDSAVNDDARPSVLHRQRCNVITKQ